MSMRVKGHTLRWEGAPFDERGCRIDANYYSGTGGSGRGKCSCGALSEVLTSGTQRKAWHREHKAAVSHD